MMDIHNHYSPRGFHALFWPLRHWISCGVQTQTYILVITKQTDKKTHIVNMQATPKNMKKKFKTFSWKFRYEPFLGFQWRPSVMKTLVISRFCFTDIRVTCVSIAQINTNLKEHITRRQSEEMRQSREIL